MNTSKEKIFITNKLGLHARAAAKFVKLAEKLTSKVEVSKNKVSVNGASILGLMTLAAKKGTKITITCKGKKSLRDLNLLLELVKRNFDEEFPSIVNKKKEEVLTGIGVSPGVSIGICNIKESVGLNFRNYKISSSEIKLEIKRIERALNLSIKELRLLIERSDDKEYFGHKEMKSILEAHISMLTSSSLIKDSKENIEKKLINAEVAINEELKKYELSFKQIKDNYLKERFSDVKDVCKRLIKNLGKNKRFSKNKINLKKQIIFSKELSASDLLFFKKEQISGLISEIGGPEGHFAIVARSLSIPTIVGIKPMKNNLNNGDKIIIDGDAGVIIINPTATSILKYKHKIDEQKTENLMLNTFKTIKPLTKDKKRIYIEANVDNLDEIDDAVSKGVDGIGLFRSEYLYMKSKKIPTEEEQFNLIKNSLLSLNKKVLTIRTLDIGNDKHVEFIDKLVAPSPNPALGLRAIRLTLAFPKIFERQISAILRAGEYGKIRIMLPMVSNVYELKEAKKIIEKVNYKLFSSKKKKSTKLPPIGVLIETPAAALISESLGKYCDFFAIGTNDLTMYTLAIDRGDESVAKIYDPAHLSVFKLIKMACDSGKKLRIPVSVCGEIAGDSFFIPILIGMGINILSMSPSRILRIKQIISVLNFMETTKLSEKILNESDNEKIKDFLIKFNNSITLNN